MIILQRFYIDLNEYEVFDNEIQRIDGIGTNNKIYKKYGFTKRTRVFIIKLLKFRIRLEYLLSSKKLVSYPLRQFIRDNIKKKRMIKNSEGRKHRVGLPVRGQRTHSNARTSRKLMFIDNPFKKKKEMVKKKKPIKPKKIKKKTKKNK